ncbi:MAG: DUF6492 family protein [Acidimicrobiales bacterium]
MDDVAVVTPTHGPDRMLCKQLNASVLEFTPWTHYIVVDRRDLRLFVDLAGTRTKVITTEQILPAEFVHLAFTRRWLSPWTLRPINGWIIQQMIKISAAWFAKAELLLLADSDSVIARELDSSVLRNGSMTRTFRCKAGITPTMGWHLEWHQNACRMLGVEPESPPIDDFIGPVRVWDRELVRGMCARIEAVAGTRWQRLVSRTPQFAEFELYGRYLTRVLGGEAPVVFDDVERCHNYWDPMPMSEEVAREFISSFTGMHYAYMISSHSNTNWSIRDLIRRRISQGRLP